MNINEIGNKFSTLGIELQIFFTLVLVADEEGNIAVKKTDLAKYLRTSVQTVGKYLKTFAGAKMLKYKFSGEGMFNPEFYYVGPPERKAEIVERYKSFNSDI